MQTKGGVNIPHATFVRWTEHHDRRLPHNAEYKYPCAHVIMQFAIDLQGCDIRGGVAGDTAWEVCCRLLSEASTGCDENMFSGDLAALIVYWLESNDVHSSHKTLLYQGMAEDLSARGKSMQTDQDVLSSWHGSSSLLESR